jgi:histone acetyltransferase 1
VAHDSPDLIFHPAFTYPIYGDEEKIYGYADLLIDLRFASGSLAQFLNVSYSKRLASSTVDDVEGTLAKFIPPGYHTDEAAFLQQVEHDTLSFRPHGDMISSYSCVKSTSEGEETVEFEVYHVRIACPKVPILTISKSTWDTPGFKEYHRRLQLFVLLYIEGGSYIDEDENGWEFMVL